MQKSNKNKKYTFLNKEFPILDGNINFNDLVAKFIAAELKYLGKFISVICQVREADNSHFTLGDRFPIEVSNEKDINDYIDYLSNKMAVLDNNKYHPEQAISLYFNYANTDLDDYVIRQNKIRLSNYKPNIDFTEDIPLDLPLNTNYLSWGTVSEWIGSNISKVSELTVDASKNLNRWVEVTFLDKINREVKVYSNISELKIIRFTDKVVSYLHDEFIRLVGDRSYHVKNNKLFFIFERLFSKDFITNLKPNKKFSLDLMTLDVETYLDADNKMFIYCISFFDGKNSKSFYLTDYKNIDYLIKDLLSTILSRKYSSKFIYIHNSSAFDLIFLLKYIVSYGSVKVEPIIKDGKFIILDVRFGPHYLYKLSFRDSILLLPDSLAKLGKSFKVDNVKDLFPHKFVNKDNLNYKGAVPNFDFFDASKVSKDEYLSYCSRFPNNDWSLKNEAIKYCELDCKSLYEVIMKFSEQIFNDFKVNTSATPTLPSAAFKIFRTHFIPNGVKIPAITGKIFDDLNKAFYGGHVDMYIPKNSKGEKLYHYDVNSLYPYVMKTFKIPTSIVAYFKGDIVNMVEYKKLYKDCVGFFNVKVTAPKGIMHPLLPHKINNSSVYGEGVWSGWYYSEELLNAVKYGYTYQIIEGYLFDSADIFSGYIDKLYQMKEQSQKDTPNYLISKLLMNSLYGRFGMKRSMVNHEIVKPKNVDKFIAKIGFENFIDKVDIGNKSIISYRLQFERTPKINMAISAAITANARIHMSQFKNNPDYNLYYSDTDSIFIDKQLPDQLVDSKKLGLMKLEHILTKFIALGPKVYGGVDVNGVEFVKTKGLKTPLTLIDLENLLNQEFSLDLNQEKWFENMEDGSMSIKDSPYNLRPTEFKRDLVYENKYLVATKNKIINEQ